MPAARHPDFSSHPGARVARLLHHPAARTTGCKHSNHPEGIRSTRQLVRGVGPDSIIRPPPRHQLSQREASRKAPPPAGADKITDPDVIRAHQKPENAGAGRQVLPPRGGETWPLRQVNWRPSTPSTPRPGPPVSSRRGAPTARSGPQKTPEAPTPPPPEAAPPVSSRGMPSLPGRGH